MRIKLDIGGLMPVVSLHADTMIGFGEKKPENEHIILRLFSSLTYSNMFES